MKISSCRLCIPLLLACVMLAAAIAQAGSLTVGTKVIYPGGTDQPPKEKDTGVKLQGKAFGGGDTEEAVIPEGGGTAAPTTLGQDTSTEQWDTLLEEGHPEEVLREALKDATPTGLAYRALAIFQTGKEEEAGEIARKILHDPSLPEDLKERLLELLPED